MKEIYRRYLIFFSTIAAIGCYGYAVAGFGSYIVGKPKVSWLTLGTGGGIFFTFLALYLYKKFKL